MRCPFCRVDNDRVIDSRSIDDGANIRRRRECLSCRRRFTTYERVERQSLSVVKKGGVREPFDRGKIRAGLGIACGKRPITEQDIEALVSAIESECYDNYESEVPSHAIGERVMELLRGIDQVAYVRFASVYREFKDARDFVDELEPILAGDRGAARMVVGGQAKGAQGETEADQRGPDRPAEIVIESRSS